MKKLFCCFFKDKASEDEKVTFTKVSNNQLSIEKEISNIDRSIYSSSEQQRIDDLTQKSSEALERMKSYQAKV